MSGPGIVTLASMRLQSQERADQLNSSFLSTSEWNRNIMGSYKELYDLLISAYGTDYYVNTPVSFQTDGVTFLYPLPDGTTTFTNVITQTTITPPAFYKLLGVDLALVANQNQSWVTVRPFNFADRNRYAVPNFQSFYGVTNLRYRLDGNKLWLTPVPASGQTIQIWYIPRPSDIQPEIVSTTAVNASTTVPCTDTTNLATGMYVQAPGNLTAIPAGTTISTINANTSIVLSTTVTLSANTLLRCWSDSTTIDGVSGWEEYIIVDAALKAIGKEESDPSLLGAQKLAMVKRLQDMAANRDAANPATVADVQWSDFWWPTGSGSGSGWGAF